jgi:hypothetical protein
MQRDPVSGHKISTRTLAVLTALELVLGFLVVSPDKSLAALLTFDDLINGQVSYAFDGDGDLLNDVIFSTTDPLGFNTLGPGPNMSFIHEPGLEGTSLLNPDLRVDFLVGALDSLSLGFALDSFTEDDTASFQIYDAADNLLASVTQLGLYSLPNGTDPSTFPEGYISTSFSGVASYALFDFTSDIGRYIIDDFEGTFGTSEVPVQVPEPTTLLLLGAGLAGVAVLRRKRMM